MEWPIVTQKCGCVYSFPHLHEGIELYFSPHVGKPALLSYYHPYFYAELCFFVFKAVILLSDLAGKQRAKENSIHFTSPPCVTK